MKVVAALILTMAGTLALLLWFAATLLSYLH